MGSEVSSWLARFQFYPYIYIHSDEARSQGKRPMGRRRKKLIPGAKCGLEPSLTPTQIYPQMEMDLLNLYITLLEYHLNK